MPMKRLFILKDNCLKFSLYTQKKINILKKYVKVMYGYDIKFSVGTTPILLLFFLLSISIIRLIDLFSSNVSAIVLLKQNLYNTYTIYE